MLAANAARFLNLGASGGGLVLVFAFEPNLDLRLLGVALC
jgi:hypothetical protein